MAYIQQEAKLHRGRFSFVPIPKKPTSSSDTHTQRVAIREGDYQPPPDTIPKPYVRFQMANVGQLHQHDILIHLWTPALGSHIDLILTEDDH